MAGYAKNTVASPATLTFAAAGDAPRSGGGIEVVAGLDEGQVCAAFELHQEWAREVGFEIDAVGWETLVRDLLASGRYNVVVAWDGPHPVGCAEVHIIYDCQRGENMICGQRGYVLPKYRNRGVFKAVVEATVGVGSFLGIRRQRIGAIIGESGLYESYGFKPVEVVLERNV